MTVDQALMQLHHALLEADPHSAPSLIVVGRAHGRVSSVDTLMGEKDWALPPKEIFQRYLLPCLAHMQPKLTKAGA